MTQLKTIHIRRQVEREEFDYPLLTHVLSPYAAKRQKIHGLLKSGEIVRVKKGLYVFGDDYRRAPVCKETLANLIYGPSCVSLESALSYYGLIPERVHHVTSVTAAKDKQFDTPLGSFTYKHLHPKRYSAGVNLVWIDALHPVFLATPEKALADYLVVHKIRHLKLPQDAQIFLEDDLRIDRVHWSKIDVSKLFGLNQIYKLSGLHAIASFLGSFSR